MSEQHQFETEGDARQYLEQNPDEAVEIEHLDTGNCAWLRVDGEGELRAFMQHPLVGLTEASTYGDEERLDDDPNLAVTAIDADDAPVPWEKIL